MSDKWDEIQKDISELDDGIFDDSQVLELSKIIDNELNKKAAKASRKTIIYLIAILGFIYLVINPIIKLGHPNPKKLDNDMIGEGWSKLDMILETKINLTVPYHNYADAQVKDLNFGAYEINLMTYYDTEGAMRNTNDCIVDISRGDYGVCDGLFSIIMNRFGNEKVNGIDEDLINNTLEMVEGLPTSAVIFADMEFKNTLKLDDVFKMFENYEDNLKNVFVYLDRTNNAFSISMNGMSGYVIHDEEINEKYPGLDFVMNSENYLDKIDEYTEYFKSSVNFLYDSSLFMMPHFMIKNMVDYVNSDEYAIESKGVIITMTKQEFLDFYNENEEVISSYRIEDINLY